IPLLIAPAATFFVLRFQIRNHRMLLDVERMANRDELTGLLSRRAFMHQSMARLHADKRCTVFLADLDWFKDVNDTYGHAAGDEALRHVGGIFKQVFNADTLTSRLGGEEFVALFDFETIGEAHRLAESLRQKIKYTPCVFEGKSIPLSISIGIAVSNETDSIDTILSRADAALYSAKDSGRNKTLLAA
ncbi:MAG: GGDEF domain-containing protein, partial [Rhizobiaceae bacterium]